MKLLSILRWIGVMLVSLLGFLTAPIVFPIAYLLRNVDIVRNKLLYYYYDDEDGLYGTRWFREAKNLKENTFKCAYLWSAIRNPAWNLQASLKPNFDKPKYILSASGSLKKNSEYVIDIKQMAVLKYVTNGFYSDNKGEYLSLEHSIIGSRLVWFWLGNSLHFRYSFAKNIFGNIWVEMQFGTSETRYTWRLKIKNVNLWKES